MLQRAEGWRKRNGVREKGREGVGEIEVLEGEKGNERKGERKGEKEDGSREVMGISWNSEY